MASMQNSSGRNLNGFHVLAAFIGFFLVIFAVNGVMIYKAETTFGGLDTDNAYRKGLNYNDRISEAETQAKLGWSDRLDYAAETKRMRVYLTDQTGSAIPGLTVIATLQRPATSRYDHDVALTQTGDTYEADVGNLDPGWWTVNIHAHRGNEVTPLYEARRRLWIKP